MISTEVVTYSVHSIVNIHIRAHLNFPMHGSILPHCVHLSDQTIIAFPYRQITVTSNFIFFYVVFSVGVVIFFIYWNPTDHRDFIVVCGQSLTGGLIFSLYVSGSVDCGYFVLYLYSSVGGSVSCAYW